MRSDKLYKVSTGTIFFLTHLSHFLPPYPGGHASQVGSLSSAMKHVGLNLENNSNVMKTFKE